MLQSSVGQYAVITVNYWAFTLTDGALRMLVILYFYQLGYSPFTIALLFILYELLGVITNGWGGWLGAKLGLNITMQCGLGLQIIALTMLLADPSVLTPWYVMLSQALSGAAKDLNKMSAKSTIKTLIPSDQSSRLYRWVALLTGSKNTLKGAGFFLGGLLLSTVGFQGAVGIMALGLSAIFLASLFLLNKRIGVTPFTPKFTQLFSHHSAVNRLSAARFFLFGSRDIWFAVALPVFLHQQLGWNHTSVGTTLALWIIAYGMIQAIAPSIARATTYRHARHHLLVWGSGLSIASLATALLVFSPFAATWNVLAAVFLLGGCFAINSSIHSYLIVAYAREDGVSIDVGFYYMANAAGRLVGILLSGLVYQTYGLAACFLLSTIFVGLALVLCKGLPK